MNPTRSQKTTIMLLIIGLCVWFGLIGCTNREAEGDNFSSSWSDEEILTFFETAEANDILFDIMTPSERAHMERICMDEEAKMKRVRAYLQVADINDIPPFEEVEAILFLDDYSPNLCKFVVVIGDISTAEKRLEIKLIYNVMGVKISPQKIITDRNWIERITTSFKNAKRCQNEIECYWTEVNAYFITPQKGYVIRCDYDKEKNIIYSSDYRSEQLVKDFKELGLVDGPYEPIRRDEAMRSLLIQEKYHNHDNTKK